jgi:tRNA(Ile)-lysidine synthase
MAKKEGNNRMLAEVCRTIKQLGMLEQNDRVIVAVSGGPDSMALLHILLTLQAEYSIELFVAHVNHMFRGAEADADADFVKKIASRWGVPCFATRIDVPARMVDRGLSAQVTARETRYQYFNHIAAITGATKIAVGHTADDQAETVLMRFLRGSGPEGLAGIPAVRGGIIRPLIDVFRAQVEEYCCAQQIEVRRDPSNLKPVYLRNRIRNQLIPVLEKEYNNALRRNIINLADILQGEEGYWTDIVRKEMYSCVSWCDDGPHILAVPFKQVALALQRRLLRAILAKIGISGAGFFHIEGLRELVIGGTVGQCADLPGEYLAVKLYSDIVFEKKRSRHLPEPVPQLLLNIPGSTDVPGLGIVIHASLEAARHAELPGGYFFDWERLNKPIYVRTRLPGDKFYHTGIGHRKKLKEFFIDQKVPQAERDKVLIVTHGEEILLIFGYYVDDRLLADGDTKRILRIVIGEG